MLGKSLVLGTALVVGLSNVALAHFGMVIPSSSVVTDKNAAEMPCEEKLFWGIFCDEKSPTLKQRLEKEESNHKRGVRDIGGKGDRGVQRGEHDLILGWEEKTEILEGQQKE